MSLTRKHLEPAATAIGAAMLAAGVESIDALPEPARYLAQEWRRQCATAAAHFSPDRFDQWAREVATGRRSAIDGSRIPARASA